ncbi:hypothetical protein [Methanobrevibacter arboriphilus]|uniref:hypothetical protein n=1 Tax=Methanobrevibacter arboriphilus TaxID=39441 RepID=UPI000A40C996|nr:hypothetical protein [Methanobrevibacter arboriphilus]
MKLELFGLTEIPLVIKGEDIDELILSSLKKTKRQLEKWRYNINSRNTNIKS